MLAAMPCNPSLVAVKKKIKNAVTRAACEGTSVRPPGPEYDRKLDPVLVSGVLRELAKLAVE